MIEFNRQREKTPGQIVNEFEEMLEIERKRSPPEDDSSGNVSKPLGSAREDAAEKVNAGVSGRTLEKGKKVKQKAAEKTPPEGRPVRTGGRDSKKTQQGIETRCLVWSW